MHDNMFVLDSAISVCFFRDFIQQSGAVVQARSDNCVHNHLHSVYQRIVPYVSQRMNVVVAEFAYGVNLSAKRMICFYVDTEQTDVVNER